MDTIRVCWQVVVNQALWGSVNCCARFNLRGFCCRRDLAWRRQLEPRRRRRPGEVNTLLSLQLDSTLLDY